MAVLLVPYLQSSLSYKSSVTRIAKSTLHFQGPLWQRSFYDHIHRNGRDWQALHEYILANPQN